MTDAELLELIDELTQPIKIDVWQGMTKHVRTDPPLLDQLHAAVTSSLGGTGAGSQAARERTPLDVIAFTLYEDIDGRVRSWRLEAGKPTNGGLSHLLREWYVDFSKYGRGEDEERRYFHIVAGWVKAIQDIIDPPHRVEITSPCPNCGQLWVTRGHGHDAESVRALWAVWRPRDEDSEANCQGCGKVWHGVSQMRSLRIAIDENDTPKIDA